ncbi:xanthine dehydrogenase/oxidase-like [Cydia amplana]|uniref:xanthine dehydrogenase/oxidase-like n=1 Tax=Cydia amplana TaxID=1869771 RepID=UPI002FE61706
MEDTIYNHHNGEIYTDRTWNYYIMGAKDIPNDFRVYLARNRPNPVGILGSKATGEPPLCLSHCVVDALRVAIDASRQDSGYDTEHFLNIDVPVTNESVVDAADVKISEFLLYEP